MNIFGNMSTMFGKVAPGMCRISMSGNVAIKTGSGYKAYNVDTGKLTNCDNFAFDIGEDMFFIIPTNHVKRGDIILASGKPRCVIEVGKNEIRAFCYEDGTIETIVPERHMFLGKQYFYGKIMSLFGNMMTKGKGGMNDIFKFMMLSEMMKGGENASMSGMMPMMFMMNGGGMNLFDGMFDMSDDEDIEVEEGEDE